MEITVPQAGESITEAILAEWIKPDKSFVQKDEIILILETDKASMEITAEKDGLLTHKQSQGDVVKVGAVLATLDSSAKNPNPSSDIKQKTMPDSKSNSHNHEQIKTTKVNTSTNTETVKTRIGKLESLADLQNSSHSSSHSSDHNSSHKNSTNKTTTAKDITLPKVEFTQELVDTKMAMSLVRQTIAKKLVQSQSQSATLSTFNEIDMTAVVNLRKKFKDSFEKKHKVRLGFMGFFIKACIEALKRYPSVNGSIEGDHIIHRNYVNMGVAVSSKKGLLVPVIKQADKLSIADIEKSIIYYAGRAHNSRLSLEDLSAGTFTISNGGVFGSLLSTPILNPPQSGILGLHKIEDRPIALNKEVVIRPMMYVTLSYDHRIIDGKESVSFLKTIKECIEEPSRIFLEV